MAYKDFGLDEKKKSNDPGKAGKSLCIWCNTEVRSGFSMCFAHFVICEDCALSATEVENHDRWRDPVDCDKCKVKGVIGYRNHEIFAIDWYLCKDCVDWAKEIFIKKRITTIKLNNMNTFFKDLEEISTRNDIQLTIKTKDGIMSVLVMPKAITLSGTPGELDAGFLEAIKGPFEKAKGLTVSTSTTVTQAKPDVKKSPDPKPAEKKAPEVKAAPEPSGLFAAPEAEEEETPEEIGGGGK